MASNNLVSITADFSNIISALATNNITIETSFLTDYNTRLKNCLHIINTLKPVFEQFVQNHDIKIKEYEYRRENINYVEYLFVDLNGEEFRLEFFVFNNNKFRYEGVHYGDMIAISNIKKIIPTITTILNEKIGTSHTGSVALG
jgi:hypothetical protein